MNANPTRTRDEDLDCVQCGEPLDAPHAPGCPLDPDNFVPAARAVTNGTYLNGWCRECLANVDQAHRPDCSLDDGYTPPKRQVARSIKIHLNENTRESFYRGYYDGDPMRAAFAYADWKSATDDDALNRAFEECNVGESIYARAYRARGNRSLSVGDVVIVDDKAYAVARTGWKRLDRYGRPPCGICDGPHDDQDCTT